MRTPKFNFLAVNEFLHTADPHYEKLQALCLGLASKLDQLQEPTDWGSLFESTMVLCPTCGNKRCPKATNAALTCTASNAPGQAGSVYA
jgi:hypothetical protein